MSKRDLESAVRRLQAKRSPYDGFVIDELTRKKWIEDGKKLPNFLAPDFESMSLSIPNLERFMQLEEDADVLRPEIAYGLVQEEKIEQERAPAPIPLEQTPAWIALQIIRRNDASPLFDWAEKFQKKIAKRRAAEEEEEKKRKDTPRTPPSYDTKRRRQRTPDSPYSTGIETSISPPYEIKNMGCTVCGDEVMWICKGCHQAVYCSTDCRKFHKATVHGVCKQ